MFRLEGYQHRVAAVYIYVGAQLVTFTAEAEQRGGLYCVTLALWGGRIQTQHYGMVCWDGVWREAAWLSVLLSHVFT